MLVTQRYFTVLFPQPSCCVVDHNLYLISLVILSYITINSGSYFFIGTEIPDAVVFTTEVNGNEVTLKWEEPQNNGALIIQYSIYQRIANDDSQWTNLKNITDISKREYIIIVEKGSKYQFLVTAANKYGESKKNGDNIKTVDLKGSTLL